MSDARAVLEARLAARKLAWHDIRAPLLHFVMVSYAVKPERLAAHVPLDRFDLELIETRDGPRALVSAVAFVDSGFHFAFAPFAQFDFGQTNYRLYVRDRETGEPCAWFFGTTMGSPVVHVARALWQIPWHEAEYRVEAELSSRPGPERYAFFRTLARSDWGEAYIETGPYGSRKKVARYYLARTERRHIILPIAPDIGRPEHDEWRWVDLDRARSMLPPRLQAVLDWVKAQLAS